MAVYGGPAFVLVERSDDHVTMVAWLMSVDTGSPILKWHGRLQPTKPGALWPVHLAGRAQLVIAGVAGDIRITVYVDNGPCEFEGLGEPPFL